MATTKTTRYVLDYQEQYEAQEATYADDQPTDELAEPRCPACRELLSWHEEECSTTAEPAPEQSKPAAAGDGYSYAVGQQVQPASEAQAHTVIWRGQLKERDPQSGLVLRVPVYRLNNGYWDCYREEELQAA